MSDVAEPGRAGHGDLRLSPGHEEQYRLLLENSSDIVLQNDVEGRIVWVSSAVTEQLGWPQEELVGKMPDWLVHPDDVERLVAARRASLEGVTTRFEMRLRTAAGDHLWYSSSARRLLGADGQPIGRVVSLRNIHAEVLARNAVEASEAKFRFLVENASDIVIQQVEGIPVFVSPAITPVLGWEPDELLGRLVTDLWHPADREEALALRHASMHGDGGRAVMRMRHKDGSYRWIEVSARPVRHPDGRPGAVGILRDVSDRVAAMEELRALHERDALVASMATDLFLSVDSEGLIEWVHGASESLLGFRPDELTRQRAMAVMFGVREEEIRERLAGLAHGGPIGGLMQLQRKDGATRWVDFRAVRTLGADGHPVSTIIAFRDAQAQVEQRQALADSERAATAANLAKTSFLSRMSHELRTPLNAVLGFAQLLQMDDTLTPSQRAATEQILSGGRHLLDLINEVLDISRIEAGRMSMVLESVAIGAVVQDAVEMVRLLAIGHDVKVLVVPSDVDGERAFVDRQRTTQVLLNLLTNAVKYNRDGGGVRVRCRASSTTLEVDVEDDGPGIPQELFDRLFEPFDRLGAEQTGVEGTGIGLALSRGLAEMMHGRLEVRSTVGVGSVFTLVVPRAGAEPDQQAVTPPR